MTFGKLRERNAEHLRKVGYEPGMEITSLAYKKRTRVQQLLEAGEEIRKLSDVTPQIEAYGEKEWRKKFVLLSEEIPFMPTSAKQGNDLRRHVWNSLPPSRYKVFQEAFCAREHRSVPRFEVEGDKVYFPDMDFDECSLDACLVSPDCLEDDLAEALEIVKFGEEDDGNPLSRLRKKATPEALSRLKEIGGSLKALGFDERRVFRITDEAERIAGTLLYFRHYRSTDHRRASRSRGVQHFTDAYGAFRKTEHQAENYTEERRDLAAIQVEMRQAAARLLAWKRTTPQEEKDETVQATNEHVGKALEPLVFAVDRRKVQARDLLQGTANVQDSTGRRNPRSAASKVVTASDRTQKRVRNMNNIGAFNAKDSGILHTEIELQERILLGIRENLRQSGSLLDDPTDPTGNSELRADHARRIRGAVYMDPARLLDDEGGVTLQPLLTYAKIMSRDMVALDSATQARDRAKMRDAILRMHIVGKFQGARKCLEWINEHIIDPRGAPVAMIREGIIRMRAFLENHQIVPDFHIPEHDDAFHTLCSHFKLIEGQLETCTERGMSVDEIAERIEHIGEFIDTIDCEGIAKALPPDGVSQKRKNAEAKS